MPKLPGINHQRAVNAFKKTGFWIVRQGKHIAMTNGDRIITIPRAKWLVLLGMPVWALMNSRTCFES